MTRCSNRRKALFWFNTGSACLQRTTYQNFAIALSSTSGRHRPRLALCWERPCVLRLQPAWYRPVACRGVHSAQDGRSTRRSSCCRPHCWAVVSMIRRLGTSCRHHLISCGFNAFGVFGKTSPLACTDSCATHQGNVTTSTVIFHSLRTSAVSCHQTVTQNLGDAPCHKRHL